MINFTFCTVLLTGTSKVVQTQKFDDQDSRSSAIYLNLTRQCFNRNKSVRNDVMNNFKIRNKLSRIHSFHSKSL